MAQPAPYSNPFMGLQTPEQIQQNRLLGQKLMQQGMSTEPVGHWTQGLARVLQAGVGRMNVNAADEAAQARQGATMSALDSSGALSGLSPADRSLIGADPEMMKAALSRVYAQKLDPDAGNRSKLLAEQIAAAQQNRTQSAEMHPLELAAKRKALEGQKFGSFKEGETPYAVDPSAPGGLRFLDLPQGNVKLNPTQSKELQEADDFILQTQAGLDSLKRARMLNNESYDGWLASQRADVIANIRKGDQKAVNTLELENVVTNQALQSLRSIFGGNPTEGERKILLSVAGSVNQPREARERIFAEAERLAEIRLATNRQKAEAIRSGIYYKPGGQPAALAPRSQTAPQAPAPVTQPAGRPTPPAAAIKVLQSDPSADAMREFDEMFGPGSARRALRMQ